jgi:hypothetical protein
MLITLAFEHDLPDAQSLHRPRAPVDRPDCHGWPFWRSSSSSSAMPTTILLHRSGRVSARDLISPVHRAAGVWTGSCRPGGYPFSVRAGLGARWRQPFLDAGTVNPAAWPILISVSHWLRASPPTCSSASSRGWAMRTLSRGLRPRWVVLGASTMSPAGPGPRKCR